MAPRRVTARQAGAAFWKRTIAEQRKAAKSANRTTSRGKAMDAKVEAAVRELDAMYIKPAPSKAQVAARKGAKTRAANREANRRVDAAVKDVEAMYKASGSDDHWRDQPRWPKGSDRGGEWR